MNKTIEVNLKSSQIGRAAAKDATYRKIHFRVLFLFIWIIGIASTLVLIISLSGLFRLDNRFVGLGLIFCSVWLSYLAERSYFQNAQKKPHFLPLSEAVALIEKGQGINLAHFFSLDLTGALYKAMGTKSITAQNLLIALSASPEMNFVSFRLGYQLNDLANYLKNDISVDINQVSLLALKTAAELKRSEITSGDFFYALSLSEKNIAAIYKELGIELDDIKNILYWQANIHKKIEEERGLFNPNKLKLTGGIGKDWSYGWTPHLKQFSVDLSNSIQNAGLGLEVIGHEQEISQIKEALLKSSGGNVVLVGEPGVGKETTIMGFVKKVVEGNTNSTLDHKHIVKIDTNYLLSGVNSEGEVTERLTGLLSEAINAGNIILYFENFQNLISSGDAGKVDASEVFVPFLDQSGVHLITTCDTGSYNKFIVPNSALNERLTRVSIEEPSRDELIRIIEDIVPIIEYKTKSIVSYEAIKEAAVLADKYIINLPNPEKSINLIDSVTAKATSERGKTIVLPKDVHDYITEKYNIPVGEVEGQEKSKLLNLEKLLHERVIGQNEAISSISNALRRARAGVVESKKPIGSFLFLGPTGVGKTETAKALAYSYYGSESKMIRFDMSEYQNKPDLYRLIGSNLGRGEEIGLLTTKVREQPFSLLLFDEVEKAHPDILNLFLQMLDEGFITDGSGRKVSFSSSIIIFTSNAGANLIRESIQSGVNYDQVKSSLVDYLQKNNIFKPEFINRFTAVIAFSPLNQAEIRQVAGLMIQNMVNAISKNKGVTVTVEGSAIEKLAALGFDPEMGARPMARVIQEKIENLLAQKILSDQLKRGDEIILTDKDLI